MARAQGGDAEAPLLGGGCAVVHHAAPATGRLVRCDAGEVGRAAFALGAGRVKAGDPVHPGVGLRVLARVGSFVQAGQPLFEVHHAAGRGLGVALGHLRAAVQIVEEGA